MLLESQILEDRIKCILKFVFIVRSFFLILAAPPVRSVGRGRAQQRRGAHSTCKLILEMCARFLILKFLKSSHVLYIYIYA